MEVNGCVEGEPLVGITRYYPRKDALNPSVVRHWTDRVRMQAYIKAMRRAKKRVTVTEYHPA